MTSETEKVQLPPKKRLCHKKAATTTETDRPCPEVPPPPIPKKHNDTKQQEGRRVATPQPDDHVLKSRRQIGLMFELMLHRHKCSKEDLRKRYAEARRMEYEWFKHSRPQAHYKTNAFRFMRSYIRRCHQKRKLEQAAATPVSNDSPRTPPAPVKAPSTTPSPLPASPPKYYMQHRPSAPPLSAVLSFSDY